MGILELGWLLREYRGEASNVMETLRRGGIMNG
jgi:hypothetical protein